MSKRKQRIKIECNLNLVCLFKQENRNENIKHTHAQTKKIVIRNLKLCNFAFPELVLLFFFFYFHTCNANLVIIKLP